MSSLALVDKAAKAIPLLVLTPKAYKAWLSTQNTSIKQWLSATQFECAAGAYALVPDDKGNIALAVAGAGDALTLWSVAGLSCTLPTHTYTLSGKLSSGEATQLALGWALGAYQFSEYKKPAKRANLLMPKNADGAYVKQMAEATNFARSLINTPPNDLLPTQFANAALSLAKKHKAKASVIVGDDLLKANYPTIHAVGKGSVDAPRLVDIRWGSPRAPRVTLVGKGVCFDSGGLNIKTGNGMRLMKKDMGGAAVLLALASLIMERKLDVQLRVLVPMVENAISGKSMRPSDVVKTRKGITVEVGDTDAEGRLILCDALAEADSEKPELIIDCATLTGAARVALGPDMPAFFTPDDALAEKLLRHAGQQHDPLFRLPLHKTYRDMLNSKVADISNDTDSSYAGSITAALYLKEFVEDTKSWLHIDMMAWNPASRPGRPHGAEAQTLRALYSLLEETYG